MAKHDRGYGLKKSEFSWFIKKKKNLKSQKNTNK